MQNRTDSEKGEQPTQPPMCQTNCGFFANPSCNGYCSKCYKEIFDMKQKKMLSLKTPQDPPSTPSHPPLSSLLPQDTPSTIEGAALNVPSVMSTGNNSSGNKDTGGPAVPSSTSPPTPIDQGGKQMDVDTSVLQTPHQQILSQGVGGMEVDSVKVISDQMQVIEEQQQQQQSQYQEIQTPEVHKQDVFDAPVQKNKGRCWCCKKKVGIQGVQCKCGFVFCLSHRQPEDHSCNFDFREFDRKRLASNNPQVIGSKMDHRV